MCHFWVALLITFFFASPTYSATPTNPTPVHIDYVLELEKLITRNPKDILEIKLTIDSLIDPKTDTKLTRLEVSDMVKKFEAMLGDNQSERDKVQLLRKFIYDAGEWNDQNPFSYDLDDPLGNSQTSRLLHNYLDTRKGNCVSMPVLHAILGQGIGLDMTLSTAPLHMFVIYTNNEGQSVNIEATSGGHTARDEWYQQNLPMLPTAIKNGMFMKSLNSKEAIAVIGQDLANSLTRAGSYKDAIIVSEKLITLFPNYAPLYLSRGAAFFKMVERDFQAKYPRQEDVPENLKPQLQYLLQQNMISYKIAEELGWRDPDELKKKLEAQSK